MQRRTRIVATVGPATSSPAAMRRLLSAGVDVVRQNFSHESHEAGLTDFVIQFASVGVNASPAETP